MTYVNNYKEVNCMPRRDGTGPMGYGEMTGRGLGVCTGVNATNYGTGLGQGLGLARRCGFGRGFGRKIVGDEVSSKTQKELLQEQKDILQTRLDVIDEQLENL